MSGPVSGDTDVYDQINITPLLDLAYVLLIIFIIMTTATVQGIKVNLPKALTSEVVQQESVVIIITREDKVYLNDREISHEELVSNLRLLGKEKTPLLIKADSQASLGKIVDIWDMCRNEGVSQVSIATGQ